MVDISRFMVGDGGPSAVVIEAGEVAHAPEAVVNKVEQQEIF